MITRLSRRIVIVLFLLFLIAVSTPRVTTAQSANPNWCAKTQLQTVRVSSSIFYAPDVKAETRYKLKPGSKFFVCINNTNANWTAFILVGNASGVQKPLWAPVNVFG